MTPQAARYRRPESRTVRLTAGRRQVEACCRRATRVVCDCAHATECPEHGERHAAHKDEQ